MLSGFPPLPWPGALSTQSLPKEPQSDPTLSYVVPYITALEPTALIPKYFYGLVSFFIFSGPETGEITQHLRKRFDLSAEAHQSKYDESVFAGASQHVAKQL